MATPAVYMIHFISDFLRDAPPSASQCGEALRSQILDNEQDGLVAYGLNELQIAVLMTQDRAKIMEAAFAELPPMMNEVGAQVPGIDLLYPGGTVHIREISIESSSGNDRVILIRGTGFVGTCLVEFAPAGHGPSINGAVISKTADPDVWQRLRVTATLAPGTYTVSVAADLGNKGRESRELVVPA
jgi:hypothetical protein